MGEVLKQAFAVFSGENALIAVADIALVFYVLYRVLLMIKGTKAVQVLAGLLFLVILYVVSERDYLGLPTLNWLLDKFIASFVVILVIIFQEDIRRGLGEVGRSGRLAATSVPEQSAILEDVVKACAFLAERRIGALIVIERLASLESYMSDGILVDARVTKELLVSLFVPQKANPTHDGAVIIHSGRVAAAGVFLPLTTNTHLDKSLGTRHRAALGLSESTDAAVVVVSEETGIISVAFQEELTRRLSTEELRDLLQKLFNEKLMQEQEGNSALLKRLRLRLPRSKRRSSEEPRTALPTNLDAPERAQKLEKLEKAEKLEKLEKVEKLERAEKAEKLEKAEKAGASTRESRGSEGRLARAEKLEKRSSRSRLERVRPEDADDAAPEAELDTEQAEPKGEP